ncbi:hypothetical protein HD554DRAFT_2036250 [Boletus coccyginus]|nr:hypothetical protein HD554DRAFT_2036250 [Boletus coccyginus]
MQVTVVTVMDPLLAGLWGTAIAWRYPSIEIVAEEALTVRQINAVTQYSFDESLTHLGLAAEQWLEKRFLVGIRSETPRPLVVMFETSSSSFGSGLDGRHRSPDHPKSSLDLEEVYNVNSASCIRLVRQSAFAGAESNLTNDAFLLLGRSWNPPRVSSFPEIKLAINGSELAKVWVYLLKSTITKQYFTRNYIRR